MPRHIPPCDYAKVTELGGLKATDAEIAVALGWSPKTVYRKRKSDPKFAEAEARGLALTQTEIRRKQLSLARQGDKTMLVWLGKVLCGQSERLHLATPPGEPIRVEHFAHDETRIAQVLEILADAGVFGGARAKGESPVESAPTLQ